MKLIYALTLVLFSLSLCQAQNSNAPQSAPDEAYEQELVRLLTALQKNPWMGWEAGTEVVIRYVGDGKPAATTLSHVQPDVVYKVLEADKVFIVTQVYQGKSSRHDFQVKDQPGLDAAWPWVKDPRTVNLEIDGLTLTSLISELAMEEFPGGTWVTREYTLASQPSIVLRKELVGSNGWKLTSARVIKKVGEREFPCVEITKWMRFYSDGPNDALTTQYLCPDVPGHLVEQLEEYYKVTKEQRSSAPFQVVHQKVVELKPLKANAKLDGGPTRP